MSEKGLDPARHESTDVGARFIWIGVIGLLTSVIFMALVVLWLYPGATIDRTLHMPLPQYPNPQLQPNPRADMARFYREEMQWLNGTGWVDKAHGIAHIPIAEAMRKVAQENIPGWPGSTEKAPAAQVEIPASPVMTEKPHEAELPNYPSARRTKVRGCGASAGFQRPCLPAKTRHHAPYARHVPRRYRPHGAAGGRF